MARTALISLDRELATQVVKLGGEGIRRCYQCGTCTATCPLAENGAVPVRRLIEYSRLGLKDRVTADPAPWLCYHCGECSDTCPKDAKPDEIMSALRLYLTAQYDVTGVSRWIYGSRLRELVAIVALTLTVSLALLFFHGPVETGRVALFTFLPMATIDQVGLVLGAFVGLVVMGNIMKMYRLYRSGYGENPGGGALRAFLNTLVSEVMAQKRYRHCENRQRVWAHLALFWGFVALFIATNIVFAIDFFGAALPRLAGKVLGIGGGAALSLGAAYFIYKRLRSDERFVETSRLTDWAFLLLLFLSGVTGFILDLFIILAMPIPSYAAFSTHLVVVSILLILAPFTKFAHALYRPFALFFTSLRR